MIALCWGRSSTAVVLTRAIDDQFVQTVAAIVIEQSTRRGIDGPIPLRRRARARRASEDHLASTAVTMCAALTKEPMTRRSREMAETEKAILAGGCFWVSRISSASSMA